MRKVLIFVSGFQLNGASPTVMSFPSGPYSACSAAAQSSTPRQIGPILSMVQLNPIAPYRLTRPYVGRRPVTPHRDEGETIEPSVSVPIENPTRPAAVAAAGPADDPLEPICASSGCHGFRVTPANQRAPWASAPIDNLATSTAPASFSRSTTVES